MIRLSHFNPRRLFSAVLLSSVVMLASAHADAGRDQVLVTVAGEYSITLADLERAISSSPFATQINTMDRDAQAALRGNFLKRLVNAQLLLLEAERIGLDKDIALTEDLERQRDSLLYRSYMQQLSDEVVVSPETLLAMETEYGDEPDALSAAMAAWRVEPYRELHLQRLRDLRDRYHVVIHEDRLVPGQANDAVLVEGDGLSINYGDLLAEAGASAVTNAEWLRTRVLERLEVALIIKAAQDAGINVDAKLASYRDERLPALLLERKDVEWAGDDARLEAWFNAHPDVGVVPERRHIGQLVVADRAQAEALRERIIAGESLFELAGEYSIDPYGKSHKGDMGWLKQGSGIATIEAVVDNLEDNTVSEVIETPLGFHLVTVIGRRPGGTRAFPAVRDRVRNMVILEHLAPYLREVEQRYGVEWTLLGPDTAQAE
jgi:peptidyl-prolyl cis-trans isomerase C